MLAQRISSINSFSAICEAIGADVGDLAHAVGMDSRIGSRMLKPSVGFGGSCFKKDVLSLVYIAESLHLPEVAQYWRSVVSINEYQKDQITKRIILRLNNTLWGKTVAILGFAYKKDTGDTRESAAISVIRQLLEEQAQINVYDPKVSEESVYAALEGQRSSNHATSESIGGRVKVCSDAVTACANASAVVILTEWDEFRTDGLPSTVPRESLGLAGVDDEDIATGSISPVSSKDSGVDIMMQGEGTESQRALSGMADRVDWLSIAKVVRRPGLVFDGRNVVDPVRLARLGFRVECIGKPSITDTWQAA
ncbi:uncharacterized protein MYCFIDRAFT_216448 [Pseudocercospora fijiensis CIRAD86]|uniref:UDP-glucose 6-dehydrogenase n=1 Tax=Pseudocercospora fijiensis (strain CIRAD86) TaxID=383855 RepID=M2ZK05_PSEFD|nr:uncharacterized protein MYCFIDRAFT_216448 [Pseudocercospora fijiensis CIRAD86]EME79439.1 hypothetical protein MYCFIDRAFT_216448 [Pseudocercospora fijiensis CIRAD86]